MAVLLCDTDGIATVRRHRQLPAPYCPGGRQSDSKQNNNTKCVHFADHFNGHVGATVLYRTHPLMEEVKGFHKNHQTPPSGKHSLRYHQSDTPTPDLGVYFIVNTLKKGLSCPYNNRGMTHQSDEKHLHNNNMTEFFVGVVKLALYW